MTQMFENRIRYLIVLSLLLIAFQATETVFEFAIGRVSTIKAEDMDIEDLEEEYDRRLEDLERQYEGAEYDYDMWWEYREKRNELENWYRENFWEVQKDDYSSEDNLVVDAFTLSIPLAPDFINIILGGINSIILILVTLLVISFIYDTVKALPFT